MQLLTATLINFKQLRDFNWLMIISDLTVWWQQFSEDTKSASSTVLLKNHDFW